MVTGITPIAPKTLILMKPPLDRDPNYPAQPAPIALQAYPGKKQKSFKLQESTYSGECL